MKKNSDILMKEYEISKESIKSVMTLLVGVAAPILTLSAVIWRLAFLGNQVHEQSIYIVLLLINFLIAFTVYQNVQIIALQMHIKSLEKQLRNTKIFRWESQIARVWYGESNLAKIFNSTLGIPIILIMIILYNELFKIIGPGQAFWWIILMNAGYIGIIIYCLFTIGGKLKKVIS